MSAGGRHYGVVVAERGDDGAATPLSEAEREGLWTLGKVCALAASARAATRQQERARHLGDRLDLARDVHERVVQRLFGVTLALGTPGDLTPPQRERCAGELQSATEELRTAIQRPLARPGAREVQTTLREELARLADEHADVNLTVCWPPDAEVPQALEPLAQTVVCEAVRNARKHARPTTIAVSVERDGEAIAIAVINDGVGPGAPAGAGVGLRLAAFEALEFGAAVDFGRTPPDRWHVRLMLPVPTAGATTTG
jgi:signal transduction histidine kinase